MQNRMRIPALLAVAALAIVPALAIAQTPAQIQAAVNAAYSKYQNLQEGKNADYIPALAKVDSKVYGIALITTDGKVYSAGDLKT
ncbi:MAG TPA: glutaminase, partial [Thermoanaerobaculia bacterium]|nr:glutaminase [Thermoanaerobaculia bacterium]